jgi:hypothetical protein
MTAQSRIPEPFSGHDFAPVEPGVSTFYLQIGTFG